MKKERGNNIRIGIFITVGVALFMTGIYYIGQKQRLFSSTFSIRGVFKNVNGLQIGNNVRFSGINVGIVENIDIITDTSVRVDMLIDKSAQKFIKKDAKGIIGSEGLMGNKIINITPGTVTQPEIKDNDFISTSLPVNIDDILSQLKITTQNAAYITSDLADIMNNIRSGKGTIGKLFMDTSLADNLNQTIVNLKRGTKGFEQNMDAAKNSFLLKNIFKRKEKRESKKIINSSH